MKIFADRKKNRFYKENAINYRDDFEHFAFTCFQAFGDRVKHWITFNEPHGFSIQGYDSGIQAPGRCSILGGLLCKTGNSSTEPYIVAHNILLSHAAAYHSYRKNFKVSRIKCFITHHYDFSMKISKKVLEMVLIPISWLFRKDREDKLEWHWMPNGMNQSLKATRIKMQQIEQWILGLDGNI